MSVVSIFGSLLGDYEDFRRLRQRMSRLHFSLDVTPISRDCGDEIHKAMSLADNLCLVQKLLCFAELSAASQSRRKVDSEPSCKIVKTTSFDYRKRFPIGSDLVVQSAFPVPSKNSVSLYFHTLTDLQC